MTSRPPRVTLGMPVYNGARYLAFALDSLLSQRFGDFELVISDNASTDATESISRQFAATDRRIRYVRQDVNQGAIWNFNYVFRTSRGAYFKWAACDDVCQPTFLAECVAVLDRKPDVAWCHTRSDKIDSSGRSWLDILLETDEEVERGSDGRLQWAGLPRADYNSDRPHRRFAGVLLGTNWCVDSYGLIRRAALEQTRLLVPLYGAEKVLMGELSLIGKYYEVPELLFAQRIHAEASSSITKSSAQAEFAAKRQAKPFVSTRLALLRAHINGVRHARLSQGERWRCFGVIAAYVCQWRKWRRVATTSISGRGIGGGGQRILDSKPSSGTSPDPSSSSNSANHQACREAS